MKMQYSKMEGINIVPYTNSSLADISKEAVELAKKFDTSIIFEFNGLRISVGKDDTLDSVSRQYEEMEHMRDVWIEHLNDS